MKRRSLSSRVKLNPVAVWELLDQHSMSQNELARRCGISPGYLSQLMSGARCPSPRLRRRQQQVLDVTDLTSCSSWSAPVIDGRIQERRPA